jgi:hypothetical protein
MKIVILVIITFIFCTANIVQADCAHTKHKSMAPGLRGVLDDKGNVTHHEVQDPATGGWVKAKKVKNKKGEESFEPENPGESPDQGGDGGDGGDGGGH